MSSDLAIQIKGVSKRFEIFDRPRDQLKQMILPPLQRLAGQAERHYFREFWALKDVSLEIRRGSSYGLVGLNGSGKSTLLQIITGTLYPTSGTVEVQGKISALLELGSGFNPDFSGRENVFLNGALMGVNPAQIESKMQSIEAFADIGRHFDQPLHTYSSGMQMRVAFAVATAFKPDILIVDEALAVGDAYFQQKCFHRMHEFKEDGGTLLFVSHDSNTVKGLCDHAVLLSHGVVAAEGSPKTVIDLYHGLIAQKADRSENEVSHTQTIEGDESSEWKKSTSVTTNDTALLTDIKLLNARNEEITHIETDEQLTVAYRVKLLKDFSRPAFGLIVRDKLGRSIFETTTFGMGIADQPASKDSEVAVRFTFQCNLKAGQYSFSIGVANNGFAKSEFEEYSLLVHDAEQIQVSDSNQGIFFGGVFNLKPAASVEVLS